MLVSYCNTKHTVLAGRDTADRNGNESKTNAKTQDEKPREENQQIIMAKAPHKIFKRIEVPAVS